MALFKKKKSKDSQVSEPVQPKAPEPEVPQVPAKEYPPDFYTLILGLSTLFFLIAVVVLGLNYHWYQVNQVLPLDWAK